MATLSNMQKQVILLKLIDEYDNLPDFGTEKISNPKASQYQSLSRIKALMRKVSIIHGSNFARSVARMSRQIYWVSSLNESISHMQDAIEDLKLELELEGREEIGKAYGPGSEYEYFADLKKIITDAESEIFVVDPYFNGQAFDDILSNVGSKADMKILSSGSSADAITPYALKHVKQYSSKIEVRKTRKTHDRVVFIDGTDGWVFGGSLKDGGIKPTYIMPLRPNMASDKLSIYAGIWANSTQVT